MLYIITSYMAEAKPFIEKYQLKKDISLDKFDAYGNASMRLVVIHPGLISAAIACTYFFSQCRPSPSDVIINIGVCSAVSENTPSGSLFLIHKISDYATGSLMYPDILQEYPFDEEMVTTLPQQYFQFKKSNKYLPPDVNLVDTNASAVFQVLTSICNTRYVFFFRIPGDYGTRMRFVDKFIEPLVLPHIDRIMNWITVFYKRLSKEYYFSKEEFLAIQNIAKYLLLSPTSQQKLLEYVYYYKHDQDNLLSFLKKEQQQLYQTDIYTRAQGKEICDKFIKGLSAENFTAKTIAAK